MSAIVCRRVFSQMSIKILIDVLAITYSGAILSGGSDINRVHALGWLRRCYRDLHHLGENRAERWVLEDVCDRSVRPS